MSEPAHWYKNQISGEDITALIDPQALAVARAIDGGAPPANLEETRSGFQKVVDQFGLAPEPIHEVRELKITSPGGELGLRIYRPSNTPTLPALVYCHGGGFIKGDFQTHDTALRAISNRANCLIVAVDYHRTPESAYPTQIDDAYAALEWVASHAGEIGADPQLLAVGGDSVGGLLAAVTALRARDEGGPNLIYQVLLYPVTDLTFTSQSQQEFAQGPVLYKEPHLQVLSAYISREANLKQPHVSPLFASDLSGLPPALIVTGQFDALRDDGESYATRLRQAGVIVTGTRYTGMIHDFLLFGGAIDSSRRLIEQVGGVLKDVFAR